MNTWANILNLQGFAIEKDFNNISIAAVKYMQGHYEEAIEILKRLLKNNKDYLALHFYIAMCYFKLVRYIRHKNSTLSIFLILILIIFYVGFF